jgi:hypothetical protein
MSGQASMLQQLIARFKLKNQGVAVVHAARQATAHPAAMGSMNTAMSMDAGKY